MKEKQSLFFGRALCKCCFQMARKDDMISLQDKLRAGEELSQDDQQYLQDLIGAGISENVRSVFIWTEDLTAKFIVAVKKYGNNAESFRKIQANVAEFKDLSVGSMQAKEAQLCQNGKLQFSPQENKKQKKFPWSDANKRLFFGHLMEYYIGQDLPLTKACDEIVKIKPFTGFVSETLRQTYNMFRRNVDPLLPPKLLEKKKPFWSDENKRLLFDLVDEHHGQGKLDLTRTFNVIATIEPFTILKAGSLHTIFNKFQREGIAP